VNNLHSLINIIVRRCLYACVSGVKDVVPMATEDGYEGFEEMIERTNTWLKDQCDILVINMQSIMVQKDEDGTNTFNTLSRVAR